MMGMNNVLHIKGLDEFDIDKNGSRNTRASLTEANTIAPN